MKALLLLLFAMLSACDNIDPATCFNQDSNPPGDEETIEWRYEERDFEESVIDCHGETRGPIKIRESGVTVRNCVVEGWIRIWGPARNADAEHLIEESRKDGYVGWIRGKAPTRTTIENTVIIGVDGTIPLYIGPGVTKTLVDDSRIEGVSSKVMVYLDAESFNTRILDSVIDGRLALTGAIAIDSSNRNVVKRTRIYHSGFGVLAYRNCGFKKVIRVTTPSSNRFVGVDFRGVGVAAWVGSRQGLRCYCDEDAGFMKGSSLSNMDHPRNNLFEDCDFGDGLLLDDGKGTVVE